jgi:hypothetical protein
MARNPDVDAWFAEKSLSAEATLQRVRELILASDPLVYEQVQYGTVVFGYAGAMASFVQVKENRANLMFHRGARIKGDFPHLEGDGPSARFMRFADLAEADRLAGELQSIVRTWCEMTALDARRDPTRAEDGRKR